MHRKDLVALDILPQVCWLSLLLGRLYCSLASRKDPKLLDYPGEESPQVVSIDQLSFLECDGFADSHSQLSFC